MKVLTLCVAVAACAAFAAASTAKESRVLRVIPETRHASVLRAREESRQERPRIVCYFTNWSQYRQGQGKYKPESLKEAASMCTHIHYAFAKIENGELKPFEWNDPDHDGHEGNFRLVTDWKNSTAGLKVLLSVGGWNMASLPFSQMVRTKESRAKFIDSAKKLLIEYNFDGLDYDWEYPTQRDAQVPEDRERFTSLLQETAQAFNNGSNSLMVTAAVSAGQQVVNVSYEWGKMKNYLDYMVLMSYDFHGAWDNVTGENSPLYNAPDDPGMSVDAGVKLWTSFGFPAEKIAVGVASYGRSFSLSSTSQTGLGAPVNGPGLGQPFTNLGGMAAYYEICTLIQQGGQVTQLKTQAVPYLVKDNLWVGYDDPESFRKKMAYVKDQKLGGVALWALDLDDFTGQFCQSGTYPLIKALAAALGNDE